LSPECESRGNAGKDYVEKIPFNEVAVLQELVETRENDFGCILMEPIQSRSGLVLPDEGYLETVREISQEYEILLIFDEVYTGFRAAHGGAFRLFDVFPDFMCFGPIIAGGLPLGALCGKKLVLDLLFPTGPLFQAGNLSSRSISYQAGLRTLEILNDAGSYSTLEDRTAALASELKLAAKRSGVHARVSHLGSMIGFTFGDQNTSDSGVLLETHRVRYSRFFQGMLEKGVYLPPLYGQTFFLSLSHTKSDLEKTAQAALEVLKQLS
jgi:glutamate-1-semialdehyde 2,1-aminomutase